MAKSKRRVRTSYPFTARCAVRYRRWAALSIGPDGADNTVLKAAYWRGVSAALDAIYICETEHARKMGANETQDDANDAVLIARVMRKAVRACRRDMRDVGEGKKWSSQQELKAESELTYQLNLEAFPEDIPPSNSSTNRMKEYEDDAGDRPGHGDAPGRDSAEEEADSEDC